MMNAEPPGTPSTATGSAEIEAPPLVLEHASQPEAYSRRPCTPTRRGATICADLPSSKSVLPGDAERWARQVDKHTLGAHYEYVIGQLGAANSTPAEEAVLHDKAVAHADPRHRPKSRSAFTDRVQRLRDGQGAQEALHHAGSSVEASNSLDASGSLALEREKALQRHAAGQVSHKLLKQTPCGRDSTPVRRSRSEERVSCILGDAVTALEGMPDKAEECFHKELGRKAKPSARTAPADYRMMKHRGDREAGPMAGDYNQQDRDDLKKCQNTRSRGGERTPRTPRTGVAMVLAPQENDPPPSEKVLAVSKARGAFSENFSEEAARHVEHQYPEAFRFSHHRPRSVGRSTPPACQGGAGLPSASPRCTDQRLSGTPRGHQESQPRPSSRHSVRSSGRTNASQGTAMALDREAARQQVLADRAERRQTERSFSDLCEFTKYEHKANERNTIAIRNKLGNMQSASMAGILVWNEE